MQVNSCPKVSADNPILHISTRRLSSSIPTLNWTKHNNDRARSIQDYEYDPDAPFVNVDDVVGNRTAPKATELATDGTTSANKGKGINTSYFQEKSGGGRSSEGRGAPSTSRIPLSREIPQTERPARVSDSSQDSVILSQSSHPSSGSVSLKALAMSLRSRSPRRLTTSVGSDYNNFFDEPDGLSGSEGSNREEPPSESLLISSGPSSLDEHIYDDTSSVYSIARSLPELSVDHTNPPFIMPEPDDVLERSSPQSDSSTITDHVPFPFDLSGPPVIRAQPDRLDFSPQQTSFQPHLVAIPEATFSEAEGLASISQPQFEPEPDSPKPDHASESVGADSMDPSSTPPDINSILCYQPNLKTKTSTAYLGDLVKRPIRRGEFRIFEPEALSQTSDCAGNQLDGPPASHIPCPPREDKKTTESRAFSLCPDGCAPTSPSKEAEPRHDQPGSNTQQSGLLGGTSVPYSSIKDTTSPEPGTPVVEDPRQQGHKGKGWAWPSLRRRSDGKVSRRRSFARLFSHGLS